MNFKKVICNLNVKSKLLKGLQKSFSEYFPSLIFQIIPFLLIFLFISSFVISCIRTNEIEEEDNHSRQAAINTIILTCFLSFSFLLYEYIIGCFPDNVKINYKRFCILLISASYISLLIFSGMSLKQINDEEETREKRMDSFISCTPYVFLFISSYILYTFIYKEINNICPS